MVTNLATTAVLIFYLALAWLVGPLIGLSGTRLWVLRGGLSLIGIIAAATFVWFSTSFGPEPNTYHRNTEPVVPS